MLILLSPAKTLSFEHTSPAHLLQTPELINHAETLIKHLRSYDQSSLAKLMKLSDSLAQMNVERYHAWRGAEVEAERLNHAALFTFNGDVYRGLNASTLSEPVLNHAQKHLRILSGLYGVLRPLDHIEPHRLEMGTRLPTDSGKRLYDFWGDTILDTLERDLQTSQLAQDDPAVINLASQEYFKSVSRARGWSAPVINPVFKDEKAGKLKVISVFAKRARGLMARHLLERSHEQPQEGAQALLRSFASEGYQWSEAESTPLAPVYHRAESSRTSK